jgi:hypothetical protein
MNKQFVSFVYSSFIPWCCCILCLFILLIRVNRCWYPRWLLDGVGYAFPISLIFYYYFKIEWQWPVRGWFLDGVAIVFLCFVCWHSFSLSKTAVGVSLRKVKATNVRERLNLFSTLRCRLELLYRHRNVIKHILLVRADHELLDVH